MILGIVFSPLPNIQTDSKKRSKTLFNGLPVELWALLVRAQRGMTVFIRVLLENIFTHTQRLRNKWV
ncbi:hypothetical protein HZ326_10787 [Fusarium oxysporum f. sp. albedinis]|nr:hypothetical protein HZ326_10787 [Fusarium oxysporum f. sp. albedinis]